jgi:hypothetical protein
MSVYILSRFYWSIHGQHFFFGGAKCARIGQKAQDLRRLRSQSQQKQASGKRFALA